MAAAGFTYEWSPASTGNQTVIDLLPWTFPNAQNAAFGYSNPGSALLSEPVVEEAQRSAALDAALYGAEIGSWEAEDPDDVPTGFPIGGPIFNGCLPIAQAEIIGGGEPSASFRLNDFDYRLQIYRNDAIALTLGDPEWLDAEKSWAACMNQAGLDVERFSDPLEMVSDLLK